MPITVTLLKLLPERRVEGNGHRNGMHTELAVLKSRYDAFHREVDQLRKEMESLGNKLETVRAAMVKATRQGG